MITHRVILTLFTFALIPLAASAQTPLKSREFSADVGLVNASGNTDVTTLNVGEKLLVRAGRWEHLQQYGTVYGRTDGEETSNLMLLNYRADRSLGGRISAFGYAGWDRNRFAGIRSRFEEAAGLSAKLVTTGASQLRVELGYSRNQQKGLTGETRNFSALRTSSSFKHAFSSTSSFLQTVEYLPNLDDGADYRINSETAILAPLSAHMSMKASYIIRYDNVPEPTKRKSDAF